MSQPSYPHRGLKPWDQALKAYIDYGDQASGGGAGSVGPAGPQGPVGGQGIPGPTGPKGDPGASSGTYPLSEAGFIAASSSLDSAFIGSSVGSWVSRVGIPEGKPITKVWAAISAVGSAASGYNAFAIYDDDGDLVQKTASDPAVFGTMGWRGLPLLAPIPAESETRFVHIAVATDSGSQCLYATAPVPGFYNGIGTRRRSWYVPGRDSFPSHIDVQLEGSTPSYVMLMAVS